MTLIIILTIRMGRKLKLHVPNNCDRCKSKKPIGPPPKRQNATKMLSYQIRLAPPHILRLITPIIEADIVFVLGGDTFENSS